MSAAWMVYATCVTALLTLAAVLIEVALRSRARGPRLVWMVMLVGALAWPATIAVLGRARPAPPAQGGAGSPLPAAATSAPIAISQAPLLSPVVPLPSVVTGSPTFDRFALRVAVISPLLVVALLLLEGVRVGRARRRWESRVVDGTTVLVSKEFGPAIVGILTPEIVLPAWALELPESQRALLLAHESAHLASHDSRWLGAAFAGVVIAPWNVGLWWLLRRFRLAMELECDRRVLLAGHDVAAYGTLLLEIGRRAPGRSLLATGFAERRSMLRTRIIAMTSGVESGRTWWRPVAGGVLVLGACMLGPSKGSEPIRFSLAPGVADSTVKARGHLKIIGAAHDLPTSFTVERRMDRETDSTRLRCPKKLVDERDGTSLDREAEEQFFEPLPAGVSAKEMPVRAVRQVVGYYSVHPSGKYGVDSMRWIRVGCPGGDTTGVPRTIATSVESQGPAPAAVLAMIDRFPVPANGQPVIAAGFTRSAVRVGESVELVAVTWFPRGLRDRLRRLPIITPPEVAGLPRSTGIPRLVGERMTAAGLYDGYLSWREIPTTASGTIEASPAILTYQGPLISPFGLGDWVRLQSEPAVLVVRP